MRRTSALFALTLLAAAPVAAQDNPSAFGPVCIACRHAIGIRFNIRDKDLVRVDGINITLWSPRRPTTGSINGAAIGLLATGASYLNGISVAPIALNASTRL